MGESVPVAADKVSVVCEQSENANVEPCAMVASGNGFTVMIVGVLVSELQLFTLVTITVYDPASGVLNVCEVAPAIATPFLYHWYASAGLLVKRTDVP